MNLFSQSPTDPRSSPLSSPERAPQPLCRLEDGSPETRSQRHPHPPPLWSTRLLAQEWRRCQDKGRARGWGNAEVTFQVPRGTRRARALPGDTGPLSPTPGSQSQRPGSPQAAHAEGARPSAVSPGCVLTVTGLPHVPHPCSRKPSLPVMVPPPSREHLPASSSNPPSSGHECRLRFLRKVPGQGWNRAMPAPVGCCPLCGESARKPSSVWTKTLYSYGSSSPGKGGPTRSSAPSAQDTSYKRSTGARGDAHSWSLGSALGFCLLGQVEPSELGSPVPMSPRPQKAASQTEPSLPTSPQESSSGRELSAPAWPPEASPPKPPSPANPVRRSVCQAMPLGTPPPWDARPLASLTLSCSRTLGRREDAC